MIMSFLGTRWQVAQPPPKSHLDQFADVDPLLVQVLYNRGIAEPAAVDAFLHHRHPQSDDPFLLKGMEAAVGRIARAIEQEDPIAIYGDYDADGVTAAVLLVQALRAMGAARVQPYIPHRIEEGYGLNNDALEKLVAQGNQLVITVDCGIRGVDQVRHANQLGLDVIITDHHTVGPELPPAAAVLDPKQEGDDYPDRMLAGVGIAFKLIQGLSQAGLTLDGFAGAEDDLLDLVALGTVADLAPLLNENRTLVYRGLEVINQARRPGVAALLNQARVKPGQATATTIGFALGPRINAAGRMAHAYQAARLLITDDPAAAGCLAAELNTLNRLRQDQTREMTALAETLALDQTLVEETPLLFAIHPDFPPGIVGLIASRLMDRYYRPAIVAQARGELVVGSCRSIPEFHITEALDQCGELLVRHGGHAAAAGFTVQAKNLPAFQERLAGIAKEQLSDRELVPTLNIDAELALDDIVWEAQKSLARLEPCGYANPTPLLYSSNVRVVSSRPVGSDGAHLKLVLAPWRKKHPHHRGENRSFDAIAFRMGDRVDQLQGRMDIVYRLEVNEWNGRVNLQLNIQDMRPAGEE